MYGRERSNGLVHLSITKTVAGVPVPTTLSDVARIKAACYANDIEWPEPYTALRFTAGPWAGKGIHLWEVRSA